MKEEPGASQPGQSPADQPDSPAKRQPDAIYQGGQIVGRVLNPEVDLDAREIRFSEIYQSDLLLLPEECEFQKYTVMVQRIAYATKIESGAAHKGRVLKGVVAELLGYREQ